MKLWQPLLIAALLFGLAGPPTAPSAHAQQPAGPLGAVAPLLDEQTIAVVRVDLPKINPAAIGAFVTPLLASARIPPDSLKQAIADGERFQQAWVAAGGGEVIIAMGLAEAPQSPAIVFGTVREGGKPEVIGQLLGELRLEARETIGSVVVTGSKTAVARIKQNRPAAHADLLAALAAVPKSPVQIAVQLPADVRRVAAEFAPKLPPEPGLGTSEELIGAFRWLAVGVEAPPEFALKVIVQADGADGARRWQQAIHTALKLAAAQPAVRQGLPNFEILASRLKVEVKESRLELAISGEEAGQLVRDSLAAPLVSARQAAARSTSMNNLRQIALAMHNYHDTFRKFPPAASRGANGKTLLSWRVLVLPYLEQSELYQKFKLDEPWDSAHNKQLIASMPRVYMAPGLEKLAAEGKTVYVVPTGEKSVFADKDGMSIAKITDGTSNTLLTVQVPASRAVIWTQPADWEYDLKNVLNGLIEEGADGFLAGFCDGSVRFIAKAIDVKTLRNLLQANDGEPVEGF